MDSIGMIKNKTELEPKEEVKEILLYVPFGEQDFVYNNGAKFKRKNFFDKSSISSFVLRSTLNEDTRKLLSDKYGENSQIARMKEKQLLDDWKHIIQDGDNFDCLRFAKANGFPKDEKVMESLFLKFINRKNGDYPVSWEHLCEYIPSFGVEFGQERYLELHRTYNLCGDIVEAISQSRMKTVDKYFLYFVYEINE